MNPLVLVNAQHACPEEVPDLVRQPGLAGPSGRTGSGRPYGRAGRLAVHRGADRDLSGLPGICQRFRERAAAFGFVERYPKGRESVTGIAHEPWHFRYVGALHARAMALNGLTLEEYLA